jgi:glycosyltransferase involved in cell wall biosynthesis
MNKFNKSGVKNIIKINPGIDIQKYKPVKKDPKLLKKYSLTKKDKVVLYAADYSPSKGIDYLFRAIPHIVKKDSSIKFIFACRIRNRSESKREKSFKRKAKDLHIANKIVFLRTMENMKEIIGLSDISIMPLISTVAKVDIPIILLESLSMEKPIIITDIKPLNEIMKEKVGILIKPHNSKEIEISIINLLKDKKKRNLMGKKGREMIKDHFQVKQMAKQYVKLYRRVLHEK